MTQFAQSRYLIQWMFNYNFTDASGLTYIVQQIVMVQFAIRMCVQLLSVGFQEMVNRSICISFNKYFNEIKIYFRSVTAETHMNVTYMYIHPFCPLFFPHSHQDRYVSGIRRFIPYPSQWTNSLHYLFPIIIFTHKRIHGTCVCMY